MLIGTLMIAAALAARPQAPTPPLRRGYVQGAILVSRHPPAGASYHRVSPNLEGTVPAISVSAGGFVSPAIALAGEFYCGKTVSMPQHFSYDYSEDYNAGVRDVLLDGLLRYNPGGQSRVEIVGGGGYARTTVSETSIVKKSGFPATSSAQPDRSGVLNAVTVTGGVDGVIPISARAALIPMFRFRWIHRPDARTGFSNGIGNYAFQFGAALRFR
jgi:hypothetical protein